MTLPLRALRLPRIAASVRAAGSPNTQATDDYQDGRDSASTSATAAMTDTGSRLGGGLTKDYHDGRDSASTSAAASSHLGVEFNLR